MNTRDAIWGAVVAMLYSTSAYTPVVTWHLIATKFTPMVWTDAELVSEYRWTHD